MSQLSGRLPRITGVIVGILLIGCATSDRFAQHVNQITPGVTNREWIIASLGKPIDIVLSMTRAETLRYRATKKNMEDRLDIRVNERGTVTGYDWWQRNTDVVVEGNSAPTYRLLKSSNIERDNTSVLNEAQLHPKIVFLSGIELGGGTDEETEKVKNALLLLQEKAGTVFSLVRKEVGRIAILEHDGCDSKRTPIVLELSHQSTSHSPTSLAVRIAAEACYAKTRRGVTKTQQEDGCVKVRESLIRRLGAEREELDPDPPRSLCLGEHQNSASGR